MDLELVSIVKPENMNFIFGQSHFIKTVEDLSESLVCSGVAKFGLAFCEASGPRLVRKAGTDEALVQLAVENARKIGAGHTFIIFLGEGFYPVQCLNSIKNVNVVCRVFCATANATSVIVAKSGDQRGVLGVLDGMSPLGVETDADIEERREFLRKIGYKG